MLYVDVAIFALVPVSNVAVLEAVVSDLQPPMHTADDPLSMR
jgi:hypothetical protein